MLLVEYTSLNGVKVKLEFTYVNGQIKSDTLTPIDPNSNIFDIVITCNEQVVDQYDNLQLHFAMLDHLNLGGLNALAIC